MSLISCGLKGEPTLYPTGFSHAKTSLLVHFGIDTSFDVGSTSPSPLLPIYISRCGAFVCARVGVFMYKMRLVNSRTPFDALVKFEGTAPGENFGTRRFDGACDNCDTNVEHVLHTVQWTRFVASGRMLIATATPVDSAWLVQLLRAYLLPLTCSPVVAANSTFRNQRTCERLSTIANEQRKWISRRKVGNDAPLTCADGTDAPPIDKLNLIAFNLETSLVLSHSYAKFNYTIHCAVSIRAVY